MILPKSKAMEKEFRRQKRQLEIELAVEAISRYINGNSHLRGRELRVLEFGSGDGFQVDRLRKLGSVIASDVYMSPEIKKRTDVEFQECSITATPFHDGQFDLIYSNHVMEHIADVAGAFAELKRIGCPQCLYAFSVPTNFWLLCDVFAQYYCKARALAEKIIPRKAAGNEAQIESAQLGKRARQQAVLRRVLGWLAPNGHGTHAGFIECYRALKVSSWRTFYTSNGMSIMQIRPLLRYGASEWPIVPTREVSDDAKIFSSVLFLMHKGSESPVHKRHLL